MSGRGVARPAVFLFEFTPLKRGLRACWRLACAVERPLRPLLYLASASYVVVAPVRGDRRVE